jgi:hypothetical protein
VLLYANMDDATDIISAVANIVMEYQQEFNAAVPTMLPNEWSGVDADARARLAAKTRAEVQLLQAHLVVRLRFRDAIDCCAAGASFEGNFCSCAKKH